MIISDLSHFEEVVSEAPSITGGQRIVSCGSLLSPSLLNRLSPQTRARLNRSRCRVRTTTVRRNGGVATGTTAVSTDGNVSIAISASSSSSSD